MEIISVKEEEGVERKCTTALNYKIHSLLS